MIDFHFELEVEINNKTELSDWITRIISSEGCELGQLDFVFCDDEKLLSINQEYLKHDTYTDIITFDYSEGSVLSGDILISIDRVKENAEEFKVSFFQELLRVVSHGVLHLAGYGDKSDEEKKVMREKEDEKIKMFHVEQ
ncbi:MAG: rRNA maturation RNase YbeY [Bacteroidota bacterium]